MNYEISINLNNLPNSYHTKAVVDGEICDCVLLPIKKNKLHEDKNGNVWLNLNGIESIDSKSDISHYLQMNYSVKESQYIISKLKKIPKVGSMTPKNKA